MTNGGTNSILCRFFGRAASDTRGAAAIEFALLVTVLALMVVSVLDIGLAIYRKMQVEDAAQVGAQYAVVNGFDAYAISNAVTSATNSSAITASPNPAQFCGCFTSTSISTVACSTTCSDGTLAGTYATVSAQASYSTILNYGVVPSAYTYSSQSTVRLQ